MDLLSRGIAALLALKCVKAAIKYFTVAGRDGNETIPDGIAILMRGLACDGFVHPDIDDDHFPGADPFVSTKGVRPVEIDMNVWSDSEAAAFLAAMVPPMQFVGPAKGIKWAADNPGAQRKNPLVISGQKCRSDEEVCVIMLFEHDGARRAGLSVVRHGFLRSCLVLAEPKQVAPVA